MYNENMNEQLPGKVHGWENMMKYHSRWSGLQLEVPLPFKDFSRYPTETTQPDRLTGIATETDAMRLMLIRNLTHCVRDKKRWGLLYADGDQLKVANDKYSRELGDKFIKWTTAHVATSLERLPDHLQKKAILVRPKDGSDEVQVWFFDITDDDIKMIDTIKSYIGQAERKIRGPGITFSASTSLIVNGQQDIKEYEEDAQAILERQPDALLGRFYEYIGFKADGKVKEMKLNKELSGLAGFTERELGEISDMAAFIAAVRRNYGGKRNSGELLMTVQQINAAYFIKALRYKLPPIFYRQFLGHLGLSSQDVMSTATVEALLQIYQRVFPKGENQETRMQILQKRLQKLAQRG